MGLPASGKSYFAKNYTKNNESVIHISSDAIRKELYGSEEVQDNPNKVFSIMFHRTVDALLSNNSVIYDATNISRKYRMAFLKDLDAALGSFASKVSKIGLVFAIPVEICLERNKARDRSVPEEVICRMYRNFQMPSVFEGFDHIDIANPFKDNSILMGKLRAANNIQHDNPHHSLTIGSHCAAAARYIYLNEVEIMKDFCKSDYSNLYKAALYHDIRHVIYIFTCGFCPGVAIISGGAYVKCVHRCRHLQLFPCFQIDQRHINCPANLMKRIVFIRIRDKPGVLNNIIQFKLG